jgi:hypothetical protein
VSYLDTSLNSLDFYIGAMEEINLSNVNRLLTVLLLKSGDRHGYELMNRIEEVTGN